MPEKEKELEEIKDMIIVEQTKGEEPNFREKEEEKLYCIYCDKNSVDSVSNQCDLC